MATTSPDNIWTPDAGDLYDLSIDLAAMADSVQDALTSLRNSKQDTITRVSGFATPSGTFTASGVFSDVALSAVSVSGGVTLTSNQFTTPEAGIYLVSFIVRPSDQGGPANISVALSLNGSTTAYPVMVREEKSGMSTAAYHASGAVIAGAGSTFGLRLWQGGGADLTIDSGNSMFSIVRVSPQPSGAENRGCIATSGLVTIATGAQAPNYVDFGGFSGMPLG